MPTLQVFHANEDGSTEHRKVEWWINEDLLFTVMLPDHLAALNNGIDTLAAERACDLVSEYELLSDQYSKRRLAAGTNESSLLLSVMAANGVGSFLGLTLERVVTYTDSDGVIHVAAKHGDSIGDEVDITRGRLLPDTPEIEAKAHALIASLKTAGEIMDGFLRTDDPGAYLLKISDHWTRTEEMRDNTDGSGQPSSEQSAPADPDDL